MWAEAGQDPERFWAQTPATFNAVIAAVRRRLQREREERLTLAHDIASMSRVKTIEPLDSYLERVRPRPEGGGIARMIATLKDAAARGLPIRITKVSGGEA